MAGYYPCRIAGEVHGGHNYYGILSGYEEDSIRKSRNLRTAYLSVYQREAFWFGMNGRDGQGNLRKEC